MEKKRVCRWFAAVALVAAAVLMPSCGQKRDFTYEADRNDVVPIFRADGDIFLVNVKERTKMFIASVYDGVEDISLMHEGYFLVEAKDADGYLYYYYMNEDGDSVFGHYASATIFNDGMAWVADPEKNLKVIDKEGKTLFEFADAETADAFIDGTALYKNIRREVGLVDDKGNVKIAPGADVTVKRLHDKFIARCETMGVTYLVDKNDTAWNAGVLLDSVDEVITDVNMYVFAFDMRNLFLINQYLDRMMGEGLMVAVKDDKFGVMNDRGEWTVAPEYDWLVPDDDLYLVATDSICGWIDKEGNEVVPMQYFNARLFHGGRFAKVVNMQEEWGLVDRRGKFKADFDAADKGLAGFDWRCPLPYRGVDIVCKNEKIGMVTRRNHPVLDMDDYKLHEDMAYDLLLKTRFATAHSDYVDIDSSLAGVQSVISKMKVFNAQQMVERYAALPASMLWENNHKDIYVESLVISDSLKLDFYALNIDVKTQVYTGWMVRLYDTVFNKLAPFNKYRVVVTAGGRLARRWDEIEPVIRKSLGFENGNVNKEINKYFNVTLEEVHNGGFSLLCTAKK